MSLSQFKGLAPPESQLCLQLLVCPAALPQFWGKTYSKVVKERFKELARTKFL